MTNLHTAITFYICFKLVYILFVILHIFPLLRLLEKHIFHQETLLEANIQNY